MEYAKTLDEKALNDVFTLTKWTAYKHVLRQKLMVWEESVLYHETEAAARTINTVFDQSTATISPHRKLIPTGVTRALLDNILERNEKGKIVFKYYQSLRRLDSHHRKYLAHTIVDYYIANEKYFSLPDMARFAELIADRFPPEIAVRNTMVYPKYTVYKHMSIISF